MQLHDRRVARSAPAGIRRLGLMPMAAFVAACATSAPIPTSSPTAVATALPRAAAIRTAAPARTSTPSQAAPSPSAIPSNVVLDATVIDSGFRLVEEIDPFGGVNSAVAAGGAIWLAAPSGLVRIDPSTNVATVIDHDPGANLSATGKDLWRVGFFANKVMRYDLASSRRTLTEAQPGPLYAYATPDAVWISLHSDGKIRRLDPRTGKVTATTVVSTPECCSSAEFAQVDKRLFVSVVKDRTIVELDPHTTKLVQTVQLPQTCDLLDDVGGALWTCWQDPGEEDSQLAEKIQRIDPATFASDVIQVGPHDGLPGDVDGEAWIPVQDRIVHLDRATGQVDRELRLDMPGYPGSNLVQAFGSVWVTSRTDPRVVRISVGAFGGGW